MRKLSNSLKDKNKNKECRRYGVLAFQLGKDELDCYHSVFGSIWRKDTPIPWWREYNGYEILAGDLAMAIKN